MMDKKLVEWFKHYLANVPRTPENCELWDRISEAAASLSAAPHAEAARQQNSTPQARDCLTEQQGQPVQPARVDPSGGDHVYPWQDDYKEPTAAPVAEDADITQMLHDAGGDMEKVWKRLVAYHAALPVAEDVAIVWSEPRQMWDGSWYRVGSSTSATLSPQDAAPQMPGSASAGDDLTLTVPAAAALAVSEEAYNLAFNVIHMEHHMGKREWQTMARELLRIEREHKKMRGGV